MRRRQRIAISQAEVAKRCKLFGPLLEGVRAFREGKTLDSNPFLILGQTKDHQTWEFGWKFAEEKANE